MPSICVRELKTGYKVIRRFLLILFLPICLSLLFCAIYATYLTIDTWDCQMDTQNDIKNESINGPNFVKCHTILDSMNGKLAKYIPERKILLIIRTVSLINTLSTYISAWIATYKLSLLPMVWLAIISLASFFITLNFSIMYGPMTGKLRSFILSQWAFSGWPSIYNTYLCMFIINESSKKSLKWLKIGLTSRSYEVNISIVLWFRTINKLNNVF